MKRSNRLLILVGVFLAVVSMVGVVALMGGGGAGGSKSTPTPSAEPTVTVVFAKVDISLGEKITDSMIETKTMTVSERDALGQNLVSNPSQAKGKVAGGAITKGSPLSFDSFSDVGTFPKGADLAPEIDSGMVAVAIEVDQVNGVGTLLLSGDRVDVILTVWLTPLDYSPITTTSQKSQTRQAGWFLNRDPSSKMVIQNRKILVTLLPTPEDKPGQGGGPASPTVAPKATGETVTNTGQHMIVVLQVKRDEAEIIRWAQRAEKTDPQNYITLGLALRSDKDNEAPLATTPGITFRQLVNIYGVLPPDFRGYIPPDLLKLVVW